MDISQATFIASEILEKFNAVIGPQTVSNLSSKGSFASQKAAFTKVFESFGFRERRLLRQLNIYRQLLYIYDKLAANIYNVMPAEDVKVLQAIYAQVNKFIETTKPFVSKHSPGIPQIPVITIVAPVSSGISTTDDLTSELDWFFKVFNRAYHELSPNEKAPTLLVVENVDLSVSVAVDWQFMLITMTFCYYVIHKMKREKHKLSTLESLKALGLDDADVKGVEEKIEKAEQEGFKASMDEIVKVYPEVKDGNAIGALRGLFSRILESQSKGYEIGVDKPQNINPKALPNPEVAPKLAEQLRTITGYSREFDHEQKSVPRALAGQSAGAVEQDKGETAE